MIAFLTTLLAFKIMKPAYLYTKFKEKHIPSNIRGSQKYLAQPRLSLSLSREGFVNRGIMLMNMLDETLRCETDLNRFKKNLRIWILKNIPMKPTQ